MKIKTKLFTRRPLADARSPLFTLIVLISIPLLLLLFAVLRKFFDASMQEQLHRYFASREGQMMVRVYILLIIVAIVVTFPVQVRFVVRFAVKKGHLLCVKGVALIKFAFSFLRSRLPFGARLRPPNRRVRLLLRQRPFKHNHKRKTE